MQQFGKQHMVQRPKFLWSKEMDLLTEDVISERLDVSDTKVKKVEITHAKYSVSTTTQRLTRHYSD